MTGKERTARILCGEPADRPAVLPIVHTALARCLGVPLGRYFTDAAVMADVMVRGCRQFGLDGVQLTMGVTGEAEALGARVDQPPDGAPLLKQHLLADLGALDRLRTRDPIRGGRLPMYHDAVRQVVDAIGDEAFVISTLRGPLNIASQLRGVEDMMIDLLERPEQAANVLDFTTDIALRVSEASLASGAHALMFGEATCSPNFISPEMYRRIVVPRHARLVDGLRKMGWRFVGFHVCGDLAPILEDIIRTGADLIDVDYQVSAARAIELARGRVALRGNLNPVTLFLQGKAHDVRETTTALCREAAGARWILSSGCDIPPGTAAETLAELARAARAFAAPTPPASP